MNSPESIVGGRIAALQPEENRPRYFGLLALFKLICTNHLPYRSAIALCSRDEEMQLIPGAGSRLARELRDERPYKTLAQFRNEIGKSADPKEAARLEQYIFVPINLKSASDDDILSVPGASKRMVREFKEYRPWTTFEQFRKEIGKYVDKKEVARLEKYVTLN